MNHIATYGVTERHNADGEAQRVAEAIMRDGCGLLENVYDAERVADLSSRLDALLAQSNRRGGGPERMAQINEANLVRAPLAFDEAFLDIARHPRVMAVLEEVLGGYFILSQQNGVINPPVGESNVQTSFHRDLPYQHFTSSRPIAVNVLTCLDPFDGETGGTMFLPGSHQHERFPSEAYAAATERQIEAPAGSVLIMNSMLYHRAGANRAPRPRRGVNTVYTLPFIKQQIVLPAMLGDRYADDPALARLLGYETDPPHSVDEFIAGRFAREEKR